jgi:DNA-binding NarL/FixJ family response regulator
MVPRPTRRQHRPDMDIVLVDDHPAVRAGLRGLIEDEPGMRVAASAASAREGLEAIADARPDVALVDLHLPDDDGLSLCLRSRGLPEPPRVIIYSAFADAGLAIRARIAGAEGVLPKATEPRALLAALRDGAPSALDARALRALGERLEEQDLPILGMLAHGTPSAEIERTLGLDEQGLEARRWAMLARLGAAKRRPLAAA